MVENNKASAREKLIDAAITNMWRKNFQATGVEQLCQFADVKKGSFYHHFKSKSNLAVAAIEHLWANTEQEVFKPIFNSPELEWREKFSKFVKTVQSIQSSCFESEGVVLGCPFGNLGQEMAVHDEQIRSALERIFAEQRRYFEGALLEAVELKEVSRQGVERKAVAVLALVEGANLMARICNDSNVLNGVDGDILAIVLQAEK